MKSVYARQNQGELAIEGAWRGQGRLGRQAPSFVHCWLVWRVAVRISSGDEAQVM